MHQFWYTVKKVKDSNSYEFLSANKTCIVNAKVLRTILDICPRVEDNVDYPVLIWEDIAYQIDHRKEKRSRQLVKTNMNMDTHQIPPKKSRCKGSQGKKTVDTPVEEIKVSKESDPKLAKRKTSSKRRVKKKVTLSTKDNIISDDPDAVLELVKSISQTEAEEAEAARKVHDTHARIVIESVFESTKKKSSRRCAKSVVIQETPSTPKSKPATSKAKIKGFSSLTLEEQEVANIIQAFKEIISATLSEGIGTKPRVPDEGKVITEDKVLLEWGDEDDDDDDDLDMDDNDGNDDDKGDDQDADDENEETDDDDDIYKYKIRDDAKKIEIPLSNSSLSVSLGFGDQFLKLSFDSSLASTVKDSVDTDIISSIQQTKTPIPTPPTTTKAPTITTAISGSNALTTIELRVAKFEKDVSELKTVDHSSEALYVLQSYVPPFVDSYLDSKLTKKSTPTTKQESEKSPPDILKIKKEQAEKQKQLKFTIKSTDKATLEEYDLKSALYQSMHTNKSFNQNPANHRLYHALMEGLIEDENAMDKGVAHTVKDHKRKHDDDDEDNDDEDPPTRPNQGKKTKRRRTKEFKSSKKPSTTKETPKDKAPTKGSKTGHHTIDVDYFFTNNLEYLKTSDPEVTYTTSITKTKAAPYEIKGIEDMVNKFSKHNVYSNKAILGVKSVSLKKLHGYGHIEEIGVKRSNQQVYKFKAGDFVDLHPNDIKDMLLLDIQHKLFHLNRSDIVDFIVALRMFTRSLILKRRVEDLQLGKRVLRANELYKFSDGTLKSIHDEIHHRVLDFRLDYNKEMPKRKWMAVDRRRLSLMI
ncbi:hypothetical protein Tco_0631888 [Tanacetum coccineum]